MVLWPINSCAVLSGTPAMINRLQNVWRRQCQLKSSIPALKMASSNHRRIALRIKGLPSSVTNTRSTFPEIALCRSSAASATELRGIVRSEPFFVLREVDSLRLQVCLIPASVNCSERRIPVWRATSNSFRHRSGYSSPIVLRKHFSSSSERKRMRPFGSFFA